MAVGASEDRASSAGVEALAGGRSEPDWSRLGPRSARRLFGELAGPDVGDLAGRWDGRMVGRSWLRSLQRATALPTPMRGWCGKVIDPSGRVTNLARRRGGIRPSVTCTAAAGASVVDGRSAIVVDYSASGWPPVTWLRGEIRWLDPGTRVFGLVMVRPGGRTLATFPFTMTRAHP